MVTWSPVGRSTEWADQRCRASQPWGQINGAWCMRGGSGAWHQTSPRDPHSPGTNHTRGTHTWSVSHITSRVHRAQDRTASVRHSVRQSADSRRKPVDSERRSVQRDSLYRRRHQLSRAARRSHPLRRGTGPARATKRTPGRPRQRPLLLLLQGRRLQGRSSTCSST